MFYKISFLSIFLLFSTIFSNEYKEIGIYEKLGTKIPTDLIFTNEYGEIKSLEKIINNKPTILTLNYYTCPSICSPILEGVRDVLNKMDLRPYIDYQVITLSIDPNDTITTAKNKKETILKNITKPFPPQTWNFLIGEEKNIDLLTDSVGFKYEKRVNKDGIVDFLHPGAIIVLSGDGKIARYLIGTLFLPFDLKLAILEASQGKSGPTIAKTLLYCFSYDADSKKYLFQWEKVVGGVVFLIITLFFIYLVKTGRKKGENDG